MIWLLLPLSAFAGPTLKGATPLKHPIVLVHGATVNGSNLRIGPIDFGEYFYEIPNFLGESGTPVKVVSLPTDGSIGERAAVLKNFLETEMKGQMVNIIGHSLGGLDARYAISILKTMQVSSLTTVGTPHRGSPLADWAVGQINSKGLWYWFFRLTGYDMGARRFLREITTSGMQLFNDKVPNSPEVRYYSVRTRATPGMGTLSGLLWFPAHWLEGQHHHLAASGHDGMVPVDSQAWGREVVSIELDHLGQMNHHEFRITSMKKEALQMWVMMYENLQREGL